MSKFNEKYKTIDLRPKNDPFPILSIIKMFLKLLKQSLSPTLEGKHLLWNDQYEFPMYYIRSKVWLNLGILGWMS